MGEKVATLPAGFKRDDRYIYYVKGNVVMRARKKKGATKGHRAPSAPKGQRTCTLTGRWGAKKKRRSPKKKSKR